MVIIMLNLMCKNCAWLGIDCDGTECQTWTGCGYKEDLKKALKRTLAELSELEAVSNAAEAVYEADPENTEKEKAFDEAYKAEFDAFIIVSSLLVKMTSGQIDEKTARTIVRTKRNEIMNFVS